MKVRYTSEDLRILMDKGLDASLPPRKQRLYLEAIAQRSVVKWWSYAHHAYGIPEFMLIHIPNGGGKLGPKMGAILKSEGLRSGSPDLFLFAARGPFHGLAIEMKAPHGQPSNEQKLFLAQLRSQDYRTEVCYSFDEAKATIMEYLLL